MDDLALRDLFARRGIRCTEQRRRVYLTLAATKAHPTAEELFRTVRTNAPGISLATIYNALEILARGGLCRQLGPGQPTGWGAGGCAARYDADMADHAHLVTARGAVRDLPEDLSERILSALPRDVVEEVEQRLGVRIDRLCVELVEGPGGSAAG